MKQKRGPGNPNWTKGRSGNPAGRPPKNRETRADVWENRVTGHGTPRDKRTFTQQAISAVVDLEGLTDWRFDDILSRGAEALPHDAWRRGAQVRVADDGKELADEMAHEMDRLAYTDRMRWAGAMERALGGCALFPVFDGDVGDLREPIDLDAEPNIRRITAIHVLQPRELVPSDWYADLEEARFRYPKRYRFIPISVLGYPTKPTYVEVHESRLIIFDGLRAVPHHVVGERIGWGDSWFNRVKPIAADFGLSWGSAALILSEFAHRVYAMDGLHDILSKSGGEKKLRARVALMDELASTIRATLIDGRDKFERQQMPVSGLADLLIQLAQRVAAGFEMPVTRLMGMSPAGLNATGESDIRTWYDSVEVYRRRITPQARKLLRMMWLQTDTPWKGREPDGWTLHFPPLWQPTEKEVAETRLLIAQADKIYAIDIGAVAPTTITRSRWEGDEFSPEMHIDDAEIAAMEQHEKEMQQAQLEAIKNPPAPVAADPNAPKPDGKEIAAPPGRSARADVDVNGWGSWNEASDDTRKWGDAAVSDEISQELSSDYPEQALAWIRSMRWVGPVRVPLDQVDFGNADSWRASGEPDKVDKFAARIESGKEKPLLLVDRPGKSKLMIADGHHRALSYQKLGKPVLAFVGAAPSVTGPWDELHDSQRPKSEKDAIRGANGAAKPNGATVA